MRFRSRASLVGAALLALASVASADPKSDALFQKAREALSSARAMEAEVTESRTFGDQKRGFTATVRMMKPNLGQVTIKPEGNAPGVTVISDGKYVYQVNPEAKQYQRGPANPKGFGGFAGFFAPIKAFFDPETLAATAEHKYAGTREVDGKRFDVVEFNSTRPPEGPTRYFFGESGLLEGMEVDIKDGERNGLGSFWLKNVRLNPPFTEKEFAFTPPAGFKLNDPLAELEGTLLKVGTNAPDFRLPQPDGGTLTLSGARKGKKAVLVNFWFYG
jgi:outer membrane lipoprotein-sorting protein